MSLLSIVANSSAFFLPASPPPNGSSIDSDWSTKNKKHPGFLRLISAWHAMACLDFCRHHENDDPHTPQVTLDRVAPGAAHRDDPVNLSLMPPPGAARCDEDLAQRGRQAAEHVQAVCLGDTKGRGGGEEAVGRRAVADRHSPLGQDESGL